MSISQLLNRVVKNAIRPVSATLTFILCLSFSVHLAQAETLQELQERVRRNVKEVVSQAKTGDSEVQDFIREKYDPQTGEEFNQSSYEPHPLREGNPAWLQAWLMEDSMAIASHFFECLDLRILGPCVACGPGILIEFWWPEAAFETNDYCQGAMMDLTSPMVWGPGYAAAAGGDKAIAASLTTAGCFVGDGYRKLKDELILGPHTNELRDRDGNKAEIPEGLRDVPFAGQSRTIADGGQIYEAHGYRTAVDFITAQSDSCIGQCFPTPKERFPVHASEEPLAHMPLWRFPEFSVFVPQLHADKWNDLFGSLPMIALSAGLAEYGTSMSPTFPRTAAPMMGESLLKTATCSSYRAASDFHSKRGRTPITEASKFKILPGVDDENYRRLCFPPSAGQLFPVTGFIPVNSGKTAPLGAGRRLWEIGSADVWTKHYRFNYYNDYRMENLYRTPSGSTKAGSRDPDKWQRVFPEISPCFRTKDIDTLDNELFPSTMEKTALLSDKSRGENRYIHWNRKICCLSVGCCPWLEE